MHRILIADGSRVFAAAIEKELHTQFAVKICSNGKQILRHIREFEPDIILMDLMLPDCDALALLHTVRASGVAARIVTVSSYVSVEIQQILAGLGVAYMFLRPCAIGNVVCLLRQLATGAEDLSSFCMETEIDGILLRMGFRCGRSRYDCIFHAIRLKYCGQDGDSVKYLYSEVRRICGKRTMESVEKAIRDAINHAWEHGDHDVWLMYFPFCRDGKCPSNEVFISRIAQAVTNRERMKRKHDLSPCELKLG